MTSQDYLMKIINRQRKLEDQKKKNFKEVFDKEILLRLAELITWEERSETLLSMNNEKFVDELEVIVEAKGKKEVN